MRPGRAADHSHPSSAAVMEDLLGQTGPVTGSLYLLYALIYQIRFWNETLHVSDSSSVHHQEFFTVYTAMVYVIQVLLTACEQDQDGTSSRCRCSASLSAYTPTAV